MKTELKNRLDKWENQFSHSKRVVKVITVTSDGEYIMLLLEGVDLDLDGEVIPIRVKRFFKTRGQSNSDEEKAKGDLYVFDRLSENVSKSFLDK